MSAIVNSAAVNSRGKEFEYLFSILLGICPGGELSDRKVFLCQLSQATPSRFLHHFTFESALCESSDFFTFLQTFVLIFLILAILVDASGMSL